MKKIIKAALFILGILAALFSALIFCTIAGALLTSVLPEPWGVISAMLLLLIIGMNLGATSEIYKEEKREAARRSAMRLVLKNRKCKAAKPVVYIFRREDWLELMNAVRER